MIKVMTDSVTSLPQDLIESLGVEVVSLYLRYDGKEYEETTMDVDAFYKDIADMAGNPPKSSQPSPAHLEQLFEECAIKGEEVLGVWISTGLSGAYEGILRAARSVKERHQDFKYAMIDSRSCAFDEAFPVIEGVRAVRAGKSLHDAAQAVIDGIMSSRFIFSPESLTFLQKGGRIGNAAALIGSVLRICPVLTVTDGVPRPMATVRTHKKALKRMVEILQKDIAERGGLKDIAVHYIGDSTLARAWARDTIEPLLGRTVRVCPVSPVVGAHVGPAVGFCYQCNKPLEGKLSFDASSLVCFD